MSNDQGVDTRQLDGIEARHLPAYDDAAALERATTTLAILSAAGVRGRGARAEGRSGRRRRGPGVPAAGRRLRRKLRRVPPQQHPRHLPRAAADGGGADLRQQAAGGEGRPDGRPVRQAALRADRDAGRCRAAELFRRQHQRHRVRRRDRAAPIPQRMVRAYSQAAATLNLLRAFASGGYANLRQVHQWTLDFMGRSPWADKFSDVADRIGEALDFMDACGIDPRNRAAAAGHQLLHQPRGAAAAVRAGDDPAGFADRRLVRHHRAHAVDRRPHALRRQRACRVPARHRQSASA